MVSLSLIPNCVVLKYKTRMMNNKPIQHKLLYPTYITSDPLYCIGLSLILTLSDCTAGNMMEQPNSRWWRIFFLQYFFCLVKYLLLTTVIIPNIINTVWTSAAAPSISQWTILRNLLTLGGVEHHNSTCMQGCTTNLCV